MPNVAGWIFLILWNPSRNQRAIIEDLWLYKNQFDHNAYLWLCVLHAFSSKGIVIEVLAIINSHLLLGIIIQYLY